MTSASVEGLTACLLAMRQRRTIPQPGPSPILDRAFKNPKMGEHEGSAFLSPAIGQRTVATTLTRPEGPRYLGQQVVPGLARGVHAASTSKQVGSESKSQRRSGVKHAQASTRT